MGSVRFGQLRRDTPFSRTFGFDRGQPIDRFYIDHFLAEQAGRTGDGPARINGHVLEIGEDRYASRFARSGAIERLDILDVTHDNPQATIVANLTDGRNLPSDEFDCVICTQTLLLIYDLHAAVRTLHKILKPGGNVLVTLPGISQICRPEIDLSGDFWRFTSLSARRLFEEAFAPEDVHVQTYGTVLAAASFLYGLASEDLRQHELEVRDPDYEVTIGVRATKRTRSPSSMAQPDP